MDATRSSQVNWACCVVWFVTLPLLDRVDTGGNRQVMDHLKDTGMLEEVSRGNDQLGKERRKGKVFQARMLLHC